MKSLKLFIVAIFFVPQYNIAQLITPASKPNKTQELVINRGYGMFITYGINTFTNLEWSDGKTPASLYNPTNLDCDQWVRVAKEAGFRYVLLVTKHHDGFCLWDSKYTEYDVASSPVKTDIVADVSKACKKYGLEFGVYYSLWDRNQPSYIDPDKSKYVDYMINQLTELLTNYGPVCELWFDGGWDRKIADWDLDRLYKHVKKLQPYCAVGVNHTIAIEPGSRKFALPDSMIVDNKYTFHYFPGDFRLWDPKIAHKADKKQYLHNGESYYLPFEHTICLSYRWNWFQKKNIIPVRALDELEELFYWCIAKDNSLVLNVPPDNTGQLREHEVNAVIGLGKRLDIKKNKPLPKNGKFISVNAPIVASSTLNNDEAKFGAKWAVDGGMQTSWAATDTIAELVIDLDQNQPFNKISIFENQIIKVAKDQFTTYRTNRIQSYCIDSWMGNAWKTIYMSEEPMGDCKVIRFPIAYKTSKLRFKVLKASAPPSITELNVIYMERKN
jgi:alpha-L-fucosidase